MAGSNGVISTRGGDRTHVLTEGEADERRERSGEHEAAGTEDVFDGKTGEREAAVLRDANDGGAGRQRVAGGGATTL